MINMFFPTMSIISSIATVISSFFSDNVIFSLISLVFELILFYQWGSVLNKNRDVTLEYMKKNGMDDKIMYILKETRVNPNIYWIIVVVHVVEFFVGIFGSKEQNVILIFMSILFFTSD